MADDAQLLRHYVEARSEAAFAQLVQRHHALVYHAALRQLGDERQLAADVVQSVFILLAEKSRGLLSHPSLAGWLHTATHFKVMHALRAERRRRFREQVALAMNDLAHESAAEWERVRPSLDRALLELSASDREALLLRFFENRATAEIATQLGLTETAAHKRVERALEKLRGRLSRHGLTSTAAALGAWLGAQGALAAPTGLAASVTSAAVSSGLPVAATMSGLAFMSMKTTVSAAALVAIVATGVATYEVQTERTARIQIAALAHNMMALESSLRAEEARLARERAVAAANDAAHATASVKPAPIAGAESKAITVGQTLPEKIAAGRAFLKAHPEVKAAFAAKLKAKLRAENAEALAMLGLSEAETEQFLEVLMNGRMTLVGDKPEEELILTLLDADWPAGEYARQLKEVLGEERLRQYRDYERGGAARGLAADLVRALYYTSTPLTPPQIGQFQQIAMRIMDDPALGPRHEGPSIDISVPRWHELLKHAEGVLSAPQIAALADIQQQSLFFHAMRAARRTYDAKK